MTDDAPTENGEESKNAPPARDDDFPICDLPDMRRLRNTYLKKGDKPVGVDSTDTPRHDDTEEDFGLRRSTAAEAWEFYRANQCVDEGDDELTEFLDDR